MSVYRRKPSDALKCQVWEWVDGSDCQEKVGLLCCTNLTVLRFDVSRRNEDEINTNLSVDI